MVAPGRDRQNYWIGATRLAGGFNGHMEEKLRFSLHLNAVTFCYYKYSLIVTFNKAQKG
jgi:hypothetical protein